ncbi:MAG TPA: SGNH/GDSL hydrolase family protein [Vicinamibacteria bacterium]|nr:SGNH/GDSL hydrolase family protein [Vicinamibacteria bacterium]
MTRRAPTALRATVQNLLVLAFGCFIALLAAEVFLRVYNPFGLRLWGDRIVLPRNQKQVLKNTANPRLPATILYSRNSLGLRGPEPPASFSSALTVIAVGGSTTESRYQSDGDTWPDRVGKALAPRFRDLWLDNAGLDGHSTYGHLMLLEQYLVPLHPRVLVFLVGINDVGREGPKRVDEAIAGDDNATFVTRLARRSALVATVQNFGRTEDARAARLVVFGDLNLKRLPHLTYTGRRPERALREHRESYVPGYRERLTRVVGACRRARIIPVLVTQPALYGSGVDDRTGVDLGTMVVNEKEKINGDLAWQILELYNDTTRQVGRENGAAVIELAGVLPKTSRLFYDFVHYTDEGAREVAAIVAPELCRVLARELPDFRQGECPS